MVNNPLIQNTSRRVLLNSIGFTINISFVPIGHERFSIFNCYPHPSGGASAVRVPDVLCYEDVWSSQVLPRGVVSLTVSFTSFAVLANTSPSMLHATQSLSFLLGRFRPESYTWNTCMLTRNLVLSAAPSFSHNSCLKIFIMVAVLICYGSAVLLPWKDQQVGHSQAEV
mmetsp:Transcript_15577/g.34371  ORF Transcript_15577/g.34371 Transcript_15577/m.34371 type:complete len:169 (+) Transcript_15577:111-617(+)